MTNETRLLRKITRLTNKLEATQTLLAAATARCAAGYAIIATYQETIKVLGESLKAMAVQPAPPAPPIHPAAAGTVHPGANMAALAAQMDDADQTTSDENPPVEGALSLDGFQDRLNVLWNGADEPVEGDFVPGTALHDTPQEETEVP